MTEGAGSATSQAAQPQLKDGSAYSQKRPTNVYGRQNHLRDVAGGTLSLPRGYHAAIAPGREDGSARATSSSGGCATSKVTTWTSDYIGPGTNRS